MNAQRFPVQPPLPTDSPRASWLLSWGQSWDRFWFAPADPTLLGLIRICTGLLALYTIVAYTFDLQAFFGKEAWLNLELRKKQVDEAPLTVSAWNRPETPDSMKQPPAVAGTQAEKDYVERYRQRWGSAPPGPFPASAAEEKAINDYRAYWGVDPRDAYVMGSPVWSIWFHVTDPTHMLIVHGLFVLATFCFLIGFCTRSMSIVAWFAALSYIHRTPVVLFGVDTMMAITMTYLMIGPCGAALSVDCWLRRRRAPADGTNETVQPSVSANVALRLLQVHVCFIYAAAGLAKLQGLSWWSGTAVWGTLVNFEMSPMRFGLYYSLMYLLASNYFWLQLVLTAGTYFTLFFEISYPFLIWGQRTRWLMLLMAFFLHGCIGTLMGLSTFALMMLVMNMAFLPDSFVHGLLHRLRWHTGRREEEISASDPLPVPVAR